MQVKKQTLTGIYVKKSGDRTIVVEVVRRFRHKKYKKIIKRSKKYLVDLLDDSKCSIGDTVKIVSIRPVSKLKRWGFLSRVNEAKK